MTSAGACNGIRVASVPTTTRTDIDHRNKLDEAAAEVHVAVADSECAQRRSRMRGECWKGRGRNHESHLPIERNCGIDVMYDMTDVMQLINGHDEARVR
jgi:hypothetical protein